MKNTLRITWLVSTIVLFASCNDLIESAEPGGNTETRVIITASREGLNHETRTVRNDDGSVYWSPGEEIMVYYIGGSSTRFTSKNTDLAETTEFEGTATIPDESEVWAAYPSSWARSQYIRYGYTPSYIEFSIPSLQFGVEGNFSGNVFPAMGKSNTLNMPFWNICGGIKFTVSRDDITAVTFKGNNDEALAGGVKFAFNEYGIPVITEYTYPKTNVTLKAPEGGVFKPGKYYYITLLPSSLTKGFTITFETQLSRGSLSSSKPQTIKRSVFGVLNNLDEKVAEWENHAPEYVDLGLSVKWATFNVGALSPEELGDSFAWGETVPKESYTSNNYKWGSYNKYSKYCPAEKPGYWGGEGEPDNKTILDLEDDAAHVQWGDKWRIPTKDEMQELIDNCTWSWTTKNGIDGYLVTSNISGYTENSIFLPYAFEEFYSTSCIIASTVDVQKLSLGPNDYYIGGTSQQRISAYHIRPVYGEFVPVTSISLDQSAVEAPNRTSFQLCASVSPSDATDKVIRWVSSNGYAAYVSTTGTVFIYEESWGGPVTITANMSNGLSASCSVTILPKEDATTPPEAVDLGLSVKWATFNIGANRPEYFGDVFAWGDVDSQHRNTYSFNYSSTDYSKYGFIDCLSHWKGEGEPDNKRILDLEDDAAHIQWGDKWRIPTQAEITELVENCIWTFTSLNGVNGYKVSGKLEGYTDNFIFIPLPDLDWNHIQPNTYGSYWASSLKWVKDIISVNVNKAYYLSLHSRTGQSLGATARSEAISIRPVYGEYIPVSAITISESYIELQYNKATDLTATVSPTNAIDPSVRWVSSNSSVARVDEKTGHVVALGEGTATITAFASNGLSASCTVFVPAPKNPDYSQYTMESVDLGLSVNWAAYSIQYLYGWGEREPSWGSSDSWGNYQWADTHYGQSLEILKYNDSDGKRVLDPEDDIAHILLGGNWRMPTKEEWQELIDYCSWEIEAPYQMHYNATVTGPSGKSIFLECCNVHYSFISGYRSYLWSSSLGWRDVNASCLVIDSNNVEIKELPRYYGCWVYAVCPKE